MLLRAFSIRDAKTEAYNTPFFQTTVGEAERRFTKLVRDPNSNVSEFPEDFDLYHLGEYDDRTGKFKLLDAPQHLLKAVDVKATV